MEAGAGGGPIADAGCDACKVTDLLPIKDAYVNAGASADANFGTATDLSLKLGSVVNYSRNVWLGFDIHGLTNIATAKLRLFVRSVDANNTKVVVASLFLGSSDTWGETTITWNNAPTALMAMVGSANIDAPSVGTWIEYDVTVPVGIDSDGKVSFLITANASDRLVKFSSREDVANQPVLRITQW
jgi:hypothetical protein